MAEVLPKIRVTDSQNSDPSPIERQDTGKTIKGEGSLLNAKLTPKSRRSNPPYPLSLSTEPSTTTQNGGAESRRPSAANIDPISQQILQRTNTSPGIQKLRSQTDEAANASPTTSGSTPFTESKIGSESALSLVGTPNSRQDRKKGVSFLSRFIGNKKKDALDGAQEDNGSEAGDLRAEGMDAKLFTHTVDNLGFSPKHPQPPAYIKVRTRYKKEKEFHRVFLAQELRSSVDKKAGPVPGANPAPQSGSAANQNPTWALEFSKDGRFLASGGQDRIIRVWQVLSTAEERRAHESDESGMAAESTHLSAPVFQQKTFREYHGHTATILDLSWSKNNFLLSSSMDKTVRLWHISRNENLCTFKHTDFVPSIRFHPRDDRFFLAGSLDCKLRLWSIPDKKVAFIASLPDMITAVSFTPDGKTCIAGTLSGLCMFYQTEGLKYQTQIHVKSTRGQNAKGSKITGIQTMAWPPGSNSDEVKLLVSSNDSRVRLYNLRDKSLEMKFRGHENNCSQIRAAFADDTGYVICGSEDRKAYIWSTGTPEGEKRNQRPMELFDAHNSITTCAILAPLKTRQLLGSSEDPIFDLCNPPPVTLVSRTESINSSRPGTETGSSFPTPATDTTFRKVAESPAYIARSAHTDGNIIVTADHTGALKVFRQDCAYSKRLRASDAWDNASMFSKKLGSKAGRPSSIRSHKTNHTRRDSTGTQPAADRIMSWRQDISHGSFDSVNGNPKRSQARSTSPRKSRMSVSSLTRPNSNRSPALGPTTSNDTQTTKSLANSPKTSVSLDTSPVESSPATTPMRTRSDQSDPGGFNPINNKEWKQEEMVNPLYVYNGQSWAFWNSSTWRQDGQRGALAPSDAELLGGRNGHRPDLLNRMSTVSKLSSEEDRDVEKCVKCGSEEFKVVRGRGQVGGRGEQGGRLVCGKCGADV